MSFSGIVPNIWLFWTLMIGGAGLTLAGCWRSCDRFWHWRQVRALYTGDVVPAAGYLPVGREIALRPQEREDEHENASALAALLTGAGRRTLTLALEGATGTVSKASEVARLPGWLTLGATVTAEFTDDNARYRFAARVEDASSAAGVRTLTLTMPRWLEREQRRSHFRVPLPLPATFECAEGYSPVSGNRATAFPPQHGTLVNLSVGGLCADLLGGASPMRAAQLLEQFAPDSILRVRLPVPALNSQSVLVRVRKCERVVVRGGMGVRIACVFLAMPTWEQELVAQTVFEAQRQQLHERRKT